MKSKNLFLWSLMIPVFLASRVSAHCPLCTVGAAAAAGGAVWLGVSKIVISLLIGAFAVSTGWWVSNMIKKEYIPFQRSFLIFISFALTIIPLLTILSSPYPLSILLMGGYGSLLNRTYMVDMSLIGSFLGGFIVIISPGLSKKITEKRGKHIAFQGMIVTFSLLVLAGVIIQLLI